MARKNKNKAEVESVRIKYFMDMIAPSVIKFFPDYFICGNTYRSVWLIIGQLLSAKKGLSREK